VRYQLQNKSSLRRRTDVRTMSLADVLVGRLEDVFWSSRFYVDTRRLHDQCMMSLRRRGDVEFFEGYALSICTKISDFGWPWTAV